MASEERAGVLEVFFGVGFGGGDAVKRFVEDADDALLFEKLGESNLDSFISPTVQVSYPRRMALHPFGNTGEIRPVQELVQEPEIKAFGFEDAEGGGKVAKGKFSFRKIEQGHAADGLLGAAAGLFQNHVAKLQASLFEFFCFYI
ncbi:MAG: hypothetical protein WA857_13330 [Candidatus Acidiferrum sp.]